MLFIYVFAWLGLVGFFSAVLMGVTVVGVCRYGNGYGRFFERLRNLGALPTIKEMSRVYLAALNRFLGPKVGLKQRGVLDKSKFIGPYIEHLLLIYWISATVLVLSFRPVEQTGEGASSLLQAGAFVALLSANVVSDAWSLVWTKRCIALLVDPTTPLTVKKLFVVLAQDILVAVGLMIVVQTISNGLYAVQIGHPTEIIKYMFDLSTAIKPYHAIDPNFSTMQFPGQLLITCTTYLPSIFFYLTCIVILCLKPFYNILFWGFNIFRIKSPDYLDSELSVSCSPLGYIGALSAVIGAAMGSGALYVATWAFIRPN
jgi:hypothetical protein